MSNQLDNFFKNKLRDRSFEYDESAWEDARLLIEESEKNKKRKRWFVFLSGALLIFVVGISAYYLGRESVAPVVPPSSNAIIAEKDLNVTTSSSAAAASQSNELKNLNLESDSRVINSKDVAKKTISNDVIKENRKTKLSKISSFKNLNTKDETYQNALGAGGISQPSNTPITTIYNPHIGTSATQKQTDLSFNDSGIGIEKLVATSLLPSKTANLDFVINENILDKLPEMVFTPDNLHSKNTLPSAKIMFGLRTGAAIVPTAFKNLDGGAFVQYNFNRNLSLSIQPHYNYQELSQQTTEETAVINGFGLRTSAFSLSPESIRSIHAPVLLSYSFGKEDLDLKKVSSKRFMKHKISAGVSYIYLDGITGSILEKETSTASLSIESGWLAPTAFNRDNAEVLFGYEYFLTKRLSLGTMLRYRLKSQFSDLFLQQNPTVKEPNSLYIGLQAYYRIN
jgi:hypothetical protein